MTVYLLDGGLITIPKFSRCTMRLGQDWELSTKKDMEKESGIKISI